MKVEVLGNGCSWTTRPSTHFLIDEKILLDAPQGATKFMFDHITIPNIKYVFITHCHSDHFCEIHTIVDKLAHSGGRIKIFAPKNAFKKLYNLYKLLDCAHTKKEILDVCEFVEVHDGMQIEIENYLVKVYKMHHDGINAFGYSFIENGNSKVVSFTGDTGPCDNLQKIIDTSDVIFIDTSEANPTDRHMYVEDVIKIAQKYKKKKFYSVHLPDHVLKDYQDKLNVPKVREVIKINKTIDKNSTK